MKKIKQILIDGHGWMYSTEGPIEVFSVNGEMALVNWYRQGNREFNGKYVKIVEYHEDDKANE